ncbi:hypothetical protein RFI_13485 [Reticulomyxa filosa]|uniref:BRCT domain-containing protein n=1 Tax=Reticulomyxa filosa TaxID=46433 RepID=X6ND42_RETFI|nr:hypothetical protein RFI_13485 [Reticulomyxa filosa]|eukprot:ETO23694.1 hypothetical protein RFI_13485 [Reticulomyxa filosa]
MPLDENIILQLCRGLEVMKTILTCHVWYKCTFSVLLCSCEFPKLSQQIQLSENVIPKSSAVTVNCAHHVCKCESFFISVSILFFAINIWLLCIERSCALKEQATGCSQCKVSYWTKDMKDNVCINSIIENFYLLSEGVRRAAVLFKMDPKSLNIPIDTPELSFGQVLSYYNKNNSSKEEQNDKQENNSEGDINNVTSDKKINTAKRKRLEVEETVNEPPNEEVQIFLVPKSKRRRQNPYNGNTSGVSSIANEKEASLPLSLDLASTPSNNTQNLDSEKKISKPTSKRKSEKTDGGAITDEKREVLETGQRALATNTNKIITPKIICGSGLTTEMFSEMRKKAQSLGIEFTKKWEHGHTDLVLIAPDPRTKKPLCVLLLEYPWFFVNVIYVYIYIFKIISIFTLILIDLDDSFANGEIMDYRNYVCNYRQIPKEYVCQKYFDNILNFEIALGSTSIQQEKLQVLLVLGGAKVLELEEFENSLGSEGAKQTRLLICDHSTKQPEAKNLAHMYNCRVISQKWVVDSIYKTRNGIDEREQPPITKPLNLNKFDLEEGSCEN